MPSTHLFASPSSLEGLVVGVAGALAGGGVGDGTFSTVGDTAGVGLEPVVTFCPWQARGRAKSTARKNVGMSFNFIIFPFINDYILKSVLKFFLRP
jgi:hypothetical protein